MRPGYKATANKVDGRSFRRIVDELFSSAYEATSDEAAIAVGATGTIDLEDASQIENGGNGCVGLALTTKEGPHNLMLAVCLQYENQSRLQFVHYSGLLLEKAEVTAQAMIDHLVDRCLPSLAKRMSNEIGYMLIGVGLVSH